MLDVKMTDVKLTDQCAGHEIAGHETCIQSSDWDDVTTYILRQGVPGLWDSNRESTAKNKIRSDRLMGPKIKDVLSDMLTFRYA